jgi:sensor histidine kinase YesM
MCNSDPAVIRDTAGASGCRFPMFLIPLLVLICIQIAGCAERRSPPRAAKGLLDLSGWDFSRKGPVRLNGEWEFYWGRLLEPDDFNGTTPPEMTGFFNIPGFWNGHYVNGKKIKGDGFATFRLEVRMTPGPDRRVVKLEDQATAYRMWVNGKLLLWNGVVAKNRDTAAPQYLVKIAGINRSRQTLEVILQVSNFHRNVGGPYRPISLGSESHIRKDQTLLWAIDLVTFGILIIIGLHHVFFYVLRRKKNTPLYFGCICLLWGLHIPFWGTGGKFITVLFPQFPWEIAHKMDLLTWYGTVPLTLMFISALYPKESSIRILRLSQWVAAPFLLAILFTPARVSSRTIFPYEIFALMNILPITWILIRAILRKRKSAKLILFGFFIFFIMAINDILYDIGIIYTYNLIPVGLLVLILSQSLELARRYATTFSASESLSKELEGANTALAQSHEDLKANYETLEENFRLKTALDDQMQKGQKALIRAEKAALEKLRYQLNPHFLFNALASIRGAVGMNSGLARDMITKLSEFCRLTLVHGGTETISIGETIELNRLYLEMERIRMGDYLFVHINVDAGLEELQIPALLFQPLIENAVKYGKLSSPEALEIRISVCRKKHDRLFLEVANTGTWVEPESGNSRESAGIGIKNLRQRLDRIYPGIYGFSTEAGGGWVRAKIEIPLKEERLQ